MGKSDPLDAHRIAVAVLPLETTQLRQPRLAEEVRSEAAFAASAGVSPIPASSGNTVRHRLNRGGDRRLNRALHIAVLTRMTHDPETRAYIENRQVNAKTPCRSLITRVRPLRPELPDSFGTR